MRLRTLILAVAVLASVPACTPPPTIVTPQGQIAYRADQAVVRINELEKAAIAAQAQGQLATDTTRLIVEFCVGADKTLAATPAGWQATVRAGWTNVRANIPLSNPAIQAAIDAVDVLIGGLQ